MIGIAVRVMEIATGQREEEFDEGGKDKPAQALGKKGGDGRAKKLIPEQRKEIARKAAAKRWGND